MLKKRALIAMGAGLILPAVSLAQSADDAWHVWLSSTMPQSNFSGQVGGIPAVIEADSTVGVGFSYEIRYSDLIGLDMGISAHDFDLDLNVPGLGGGRLGSAAMLPITFGLNLHFGGDKVDFHIAPVAAYVTWGDLQVNGGGSASVDSEFSLGLDFGVDIPVGDKGWNVAVGASYLQAQVADPSFTIDVDPIMLRIGFGKTL
jgi:hypothetical protein